MDLSVTATDFSQVSFDQDVITSSLVNPTHSMPKGSGVNIGDLQGQGILGSGGGKGGRDRSRNW